MSDRLNWIFPTQLHFTINSDSADFLGFKKAVPSSQYYFFSMIRTAIQRLMTATTSSSNLNLFLRLTIYDLASLHWHATAVTLATI